MTRLLLAQLVASAWLTRRAHAADGARILGAWIERIAATGVRS